MTINSLHRISRLQPAFSLMLEQKIYI